MSPINSAVFRPAGHRPAVVEHIGHGYRQGIFIAQDHHAQGVANQDGVNFRLVDGQGGRVIVSRQHGQNLTAGFLQTEAPGGDFFTDDFFDVIRLWYRGRWGGQGTLLREKVGAV